MSTYPFVCVNRDGRPHGFEEADEAIKWFNRHNYGFGGNLDRTEQISHLLRDGELRLNEDRPDCSPRMAVVVRNLTLLPLDQYINAHLKPAPRSAAFAEKAIAAWNARTGPRVGDYCYEGEKISRFTHAYDDRIQTGGGSGSYHMYNNGFCSYSGGLDPAVPFIDLTDTGETRLADFWFFKDNFAGAHRGIGMVALGRVYRRKMP